MTVAPGSALDKYVPRAQTRVVHPDWARDAAIYQVNVRQFTAEGTLRAAQEHLPRLRDLGVRIVWLMPVHPIGEVNRKGSLGSPYAVKDHLAVGPEFGTVDDLERFVAAAHGLGLYVLLDWVANHTAWDNPLVAEHPGWYRRDEAGHLLPTPWWDWDDVVDLDYSDTGLRRYMTEAMAYWVRRCDVDGFRCDAAGFVPTDFWETARAELERIKPVFLLAEWEARDLHAAAFDASYAWSWNDALHRIARGTADVTALLTYYSWQEKAFPPGSLRLTFVSNHDKNAWEGTEYEQFGDALEAAVVLSVVGDGIPLVYSGQEAGNPRRLAFFERDPIRWQPHPMGDLYTALLTLKRNNRALWNGLSGAPMVHVPSDRRTTVLAFVRRHGSGDAVLALFNLSAQECVPVLRGERHHGAWLDAGTGETVVVDAATRFRLPPWGYRLLVSGGRA